MKLSYKQFLFTLCMGSAMSVKPQSLRGGGEVSPNLVAPMEMSMAIETHDFETKNVTSSRDLSSKSSKSLEPTLPYLKSCELGSGINFDGNKCGPVAIKDFKPCDESSGTNSCIEIKEDKIVTAYSRTSTSVSQTSSLMNVVATAEGAYGPFSASVGADYLLQNEQSSNSYSFFIGQSIDWKHESFNNIRNLRLTDEAFQLLQNDAEGFVKLYGHSFIHNINYGASFLGSATMRSRDSSSTESLEAFLKIDGEKGLFSAKAEVDFKNAVSAASGSLDIQINAKHTGGGEVIAFPTTNPKALGDYYNHWISTLNVNTVSPMKMTTVDYLQIQQVTDYIASIPDASKRDKVQQHLSARHLTPTITGEVMREKLQVNAVMNTLTAAEDILKGNSANCNGAPEDALRIINGIRQLDVLPHQTRVQYMTYDNFLTVQEQVLDRNLEFFKAFDFQYNVNELLRGWGCELPTDLAVGESCYVSDQCNSGFCDEGYCGCKYNGDCPAENPVCDTSGSNMCVKMDNGATCSDNVECSSGLCCGNVCKPSTGTIGVKTLGQQCRATGECVDQDKTLVCAQGRYTDGNKRCLYNNGILFSNNHNKLNIKSAERCAGGGRNGRYCSFTSVSQGQWRNHYGESRLDCSMD